MTWFWVLTRHRWRHRFLNRGFRSDERYSATVLWRQATLLIVGGGIRNDVDLGRSQFRVVMVLVVHMLTVSAPW